MKHTIKTISAIAMAFTLLGTGTAITKTLSPNTETNLTATAASGDTDVWRYTMPDSNECIGYGSRGDKVKWIQAALNYISEYNWYLGEPLTVDGIYGKKTKQRVKDLQNYVNSVYKKEGIPLLKVDGIFGPKTYYAACLCLDCCDCH
ncbi:peptidoglycan-binding protein [uncultured Ruminococcus sp.]|uniref:peptidoglycan-binding domain-containing protein n=1 Tax=uncultured Ruminococcus sp. TaxID=165186 RepID=UPI002605C283|nr:peptidoglycan-binding domain-containing protein [uncultured Ruminococcus sp.]